MVRGARRPRRSHERPSFRAMSWRRRILVIIVAILLLAAAVFVIRIRPLAAIGAGLVAKQMCSCIFVDKRSEAACRPDLPPTTTNVRATVLQAEHAVRAWLPLFAERIARFHDDGGGCTLY